MIIQQSSLKDPDSEREKISLKVGDKILRFGQVYRVSRIQKNASNKEEGKLVFLRPYFKNRRNRSLIYSIPMESVNKVEIRKPISKKAISKLLKTLSKPAKTKGQTNIAKAKRDLKLDDPDEASEILKLLWKENKKSPGNLSKTKKDFLKLVMEPLIQEVAFVLGISLAKAKQKIGKALEKSS